MKTKGLYRSLQTTIKKTFELENTFRLCRVKAQTYQTLPSQLTLRRQKGALEHTTWTKSDSWLARMFWNQTTQQ